MNIVQVNSSDGVDIISHKQSLCTTSTLHATGRVAKLRVKMSVVMHYKCNINSVDVCI